MNYWNIYETYQVLLYQKTGMYKGHLNSLITDSFKMVQIVHTNLNHQITMQQKETVAQQMNKAIISKTKLMLHSHLEVYVCMTLDNQYFFFVRSIPSPSLKSLIPHHRRPLRRVGACFPPPPPSCSRLLAAILSAMSTSSARSSLGGRSVVVPLIKCPWCHTHVKFYLSNTERHERWVFYKCVNHGVSALQPLLFIFVRFRCILSR